MHLQKKLLVFIAMAVLCGSAMAATLADFGKKDYKFRLKHAEEREQRFELVDFGDRGKVAKIDVTPIKKEFFELVISPSRVMGRNAEEFRGEISFDVRSDTPEYVRFVCVRFLDAKKEMFQARCMVKLEKGKWTTAVFKIDENTDYQVWGGNKDGKIDYPVKFVEITGGFSYNVPACNLYVDDVSCKGPEAE